LSKWILNWDKQWKKYEISLYLYDWVEKESVLDKLSTFSYSLYYKFISTIEMHVMVNQKFTNQNDCLVWHDKLLWCEKKRLKNSWGHVWSVVDLLVPKIKTLKWEKELICKMT